MDDRARAAYEKARRLLNNGHDLAEVERQEWLQHHRDEARFQTVMQKSAPDGNGKLIYKEFENALLPDAQQEALAEIFTQDQIEAVGMALSQIRQQCREHAEYEVHKLRRELGELKAQTEVLSATIKELNKRHEV
jgi:hypothetical protein